MTTYRAERHAGSWRVVDADGQVVREYGAGAAAAEAAANAAQNLERSNVSTASPLRRWRKAHRLSQTRLAELLGVTLLTIHRWETGIYHAPPFLPLALDELERRLTDTHTLERSNA
jgi:DNA-binding XRE family transcriptional regulator